MMADERKEYTLRVGSFDGIDSEGNRKLFVAGEKVPLRPDQYNSFRDRFEAEDPSNQPFGGGAARQVTDGSIIRRSPSSMILTPEAIQAAQDAKGLLAGDVNLAGVAPEGVKPGDGESDGDTAQEQSQQTSEEGVTGEPQSGDGATANTTAAAGVQNPDSAKPIPPGSTSTSTQAKPAQPRSNR
jgi:hypothetical protein